MSLSYWIRDYLYYPLGGNNKYVRNIVIVFVVCGLWHGAGFSFLLWGTYHAILVGSYHLVQSRWDKMPIPVQWFLNFSLVSFGWLLFVYDIDGVLVALGSVAVAPTYGALPSADLAIAVLVAAAVCFFVRIERLPEFLKTIHQSTIQLVIYGIGLSVFAFAALLFFNRSETFIYFRF